jgi:hypothetical protein
MIEYLNLRQAGISRAEFDHCHDYVKLAQSTHRSNYRQDPVNLWLVTDSLDDLNTIDQPVAKARAQTSVGLMFYNGQLWVEPNRPKVDILRTLIHEIAHAYTASQSHGPKWRYTFGVAMAKWMHDDGYSESEILFNLAVYVSRYMRYRQFTPQGNYNSLSAFENRRFAERQKIMRAAKKVF